MRRLVISLRLFDHRGSAGLQRLEALQECLAPAAQIFDPVGCRTHNITPKEWRDTVCWLGGLRSTVMNASTVPSIRFTTHHSLPRQASFRQ